MELLPCKKPQEKMIRYVNVLNIIAFRPIQYEGRYRIGVSVLEVDTVLHLCDINHSPITSMFEPELYKYIRNELSNQKVRPWIT